MSDKADSGAGFPLHKAARRGQVDEVRTLLASGCDVNSIDKQGNTPLHLACFCGQLAVAKVLLGSGADITASQADLEPDSSCGYPPMHSAVLGGHPDLVKLLLDHGGDINVRGRYGTTTRMQKLLKNVPETFKATTGRPSGDTPLHIAVRSGNPAMAEFLLSRGADANCGGWTPLDLAADREDHEMVKVLLKHGADINCGGKVLFLSAVAEGKTQRVRRLLPSVTDINAVGYCTCEDWGKGTALTLAANEAIVKMLLSAGADPNFVTDDIEGSPLLRAAENDELNVVKLLLTRGADPDGDEEHDYDTPLYCAAKNGNIEIARLLIAAGADVNAAISDETPYAVARARGRTEMQQLLWKHGGRA